MQISMIAAMANNRIIGADNQMPWHLPADLKHFKATTMGKPVLMGRKTYESIGKALPGRMNIVITTNADYQLEDAVIVHSCEEAVELARKSNEEIMVIGGGSVYQHFLPHSQRLYLTYIELEVDGDTVFPDYEANASWKETASESHSADERNPYNYRFVTLERC